LPKDAYYFSHDSNAARDPKCAALISEFGAEGYGIYWMIIETLSEQDGYRLEKFPKLYEGLAQRFQADVKRCSSIIEAMLNDYELLLEDTNYIWSDSLLRRMAEKDEKRLKKIEAGRIGGTISATNRKQTSSNAQAVLKQPGSKSNQSKVKESKVKETKVEEIKYKVREGVFLTARETEKLIDQFGEAGMNDRIDALSIGILSKGYKYESHYHTILAWERNHPKGNGNKPAQRERGPGGILNGAIEGEVRGKL
jgi:anti-sigma28 factor (negative regulator of flagellin synthesis)